MNSATRFILGTIGRIMLCLIFLMSAVGNKIPNFSGVVGYMETKHVPFPALALAGAIGFLIVGSVLVIARYQEALGATLLVIFLALASYYFHDFWNIDAKANAQQFQNEMIQFLKNTAIAGGLLVLISQAGTAIALTPTPSEK